MQSNSNQTETTEPIVPVGYCPRCDYQLLTAGVCPECGHEVEAGRIRRRPRRHRRRLVGIVLLIGGAMTGLFFAGRWAIEKKLHHRLVSNQSLIESYPQSPTYIDEIKRRLIVGDFSDSEVEKLVRRSFVASVRVRTPRPENIPLKFQIDCTPLANSLFTKVRDPVAHHFLTWLRIHEIDAQERKRVRVELDGQMHDAVFDPGVGLIPAQWVVDGEFPSLGHHHMEVTVNAYVDATDLLVSTCIHPLQFHEFAFRSGIDFEVTADSICELIQCNDAPEDIASLRDLYGLLVMKSKINDQNEGIVYAGCSRFQLNDPQFVVTLDVTNSDNTRNRRYRSPCWFRTSFPNDHLCTILVDPILDELQPHRAICRWQYDYASAFNDGAPSIYPFVLEWTIDDFESLPEYREDIGCEPPFARPPDRIIHFDNLDELLETPHFTIVH